MKRTKTIIMAGSAFVLFLTAASWFAVSRITGFRQGMRLWDEGFAAMKRSDWDGAIAKYTVALQQPLGRKGLAVVYSNRGFAYNRKGKFKAATADFGEAIRRDSQWAPAYAGRSVAWLNRAELAKALADANEAISRDPNLPDAYRSRALVLAKRSDFAKAITDLTEAIRCDPDNPELYILRGQLFVDQGDLEGAVASFESAMRLAPASPAAYFGRALAYERRGEWDKAIVDYDTAYRLAPDHAKAEPILQAAWARKEAFEKSQNDLESYVNEKRAVELLDEGNKASGEGHFESAIQLYAKALERRPGVRRTAVILCDRANAFGQLNQLEQSARDYDEAIKLDPYFVEAFFNRGINNRALGRLKEAIADFSTALWLNPEFGPAYVNRGAAYLKEGQLEKANRDYTDALRTIAKVEPQTLPQTLNSLAWMRATSPISALRDANQAILAATEACELTHWNKSAYLDTLAAAYAEARDFAQAVNFQTQAVDGKDISEEELSEMKKRLGLYQDQRPYHEGNQLGSYAEISLE
jgi:tetratricopeptide (TPR) repeat protein